MSWVQAELKKRTALTAREAAAISAKVGSASADLDTDRMAALWDRIEAANRALPPELRLLHEADPSAEPPAGKPPFHKWLKAPNGAGLGFNGEGIRYYWPHPNPRTSNNFWIRCDPEMGYLVSRRVGQAWSGGEQKWKFKASGIEQMLKCLVTGVRIKPRAVRVRRFWFF